MREGVKVLEQKSLLLVLEEWWPDQAGPWRPGENFGLHAKYNGKAQSRSPQGRDLIRCAL